MLVAAGVDVKPRGWKRFDDIEFFLPGIVKLKSHHIFNGAGAGWKPALVSLT